MTRPVPAKARMLRSIVAAGTMICTGTGGFVDGILFHRIFQLHVMRSARVATDTLVGAQVSMVRDDLFHATVRIATAAGITPP